jgi:multiple sugar transport system permease protein
MSSVDLPVSTAAPAAAERSRRRVPWQVRRRRMLLTVANYSIVIAVALMFLLPFVFITLTSLMTDRQSLSPQLWPDPVRWANYIDVFREAPLLRWTANTMMYCGLATLGLLLSSIPVAYALARLRWRGRQLAFLIVLATMMLPQQVTVVPLYVMWSKLGLVGTLWPVILVTWFGDAFSIFLLRQFFLTIPQEYIDAARMDGCGEFRILTTVVLRLAKPAIAAVALFSVLYCFNDYFLPLLYVGQGDVNSWPVSIGLSQFRNLHQVQWNLTMAATLLVMLPVIVIFFLAQKVFVEGITLTGVKG